MKSLDNIQSSSEMKFQIATTFLTALKNRDWHMMRSILNGDVSWTLPGTSILSGEVSGIDDVIQRAKSLRDFGVMMELLNILYGFQSVALSLRNTSKRGDLVLDQYVAIVCDLKDGKISKITTHLHDVENINAFFIEGII